MKKNNWRKTVSLAFAFICSFLFIFRAVDVQAAVSRPGSPTAISLTRTSGTAVELSWNAVSDANGYAVFMKTNKGAYKLIKTTKKTKINKEGLAIGNSYCFKVRAYKNVNGKKVYGQYSNVIKRKMTNYEYMIDVLEPYSRDGDTYRYVGVESISLFDNDYYHCLASKRGPYDNSSSGNIYYNLKGKFSKLEFSYCSFHEGDEGKAMFFADDELTETLTTSPNVLPQTISIDVEDTYIFRIYLDHCALLGVKLYY